MGQVVKKKRILLSGLGGSLFPSLHQDLENKYDLFYVDSNLKLKSIYPDLQFFPAPNVTTPDYPEFIKDILENYKIDIYAPLIDEEILIAHRIQQETGVLLFSPNLAFCELCLNKIRLMTVLSQMGISSIDTWPAEEFLFKSNSDLEGLYIVKPVSGRGSRGVYKFETIQQLHAYFLIENYVPADCMVQKCIEGSEYTVGVLSNKHGTLSMIVPKRVILKKGITINATIHNVESIENLVKKLESDLNPSGPYNVQLMLDSHGVPHVFEINPRLSTTSVMSFSKNVDEFELFENVNANRKIVRLHDGFTLYRRWENLFYDEN